MGSEVKIPQLKFGLLTRATRATQLARMMLEALFTREELAVSSVTGRSSNKKPGVTPKQALNADKVAAILGLDRLFLVSQYDMLTFGIDKPIEGSSFFYFLIDCARGNQLQLPYPTYYVVLL